MQHAREMARKMNYLKGVHIKQICDFGLTISLLFQRRCKDMKQLMCILRRDEPTQTHNGYEMDEQIVYKSKAGGSIHCSSRHVLEDNERWVAPNASLRMTVYVNVKKKKAWRQIKLLNVCEIGSMRKSTSALHYSFEIKTTISAIIPTDLLFKWADVPSVQSEDIQETSSIKNIILTWLITG